jgi:hypothetical protein
MVPETPPPDENMLDWDWIKIISAQPQINSSQLNPLINVPLFVGARGALSGDVWILSWGVEGRGVACRDFECKSPYSVTETIRTATWASHQANKQSSNLVTCVSSALNSNGLRRWSLGEMAFKDRLTLRAFRGVAPTRRRPECRPAQALLRQGLCRFVSFLLE